MAKIILSDHFKEAFAIFASRKESQDIINWLKIQKNNIAVLEWARIKSTDPDIAIRKARYEGNIEVLDMILEAIKVSQKGEE